MTRKGENKDRPRQTGEKKHFSVTVKAGEIKMIKNCHQSVTYNRSVMRGKTNNVQAYFYL